MIFDKYDRCYEEGITIGFCRQGERRHGEELSPGRIKRDCYRCNHFSERKENNNGRQKGNIT